MNSLKNSLRRFGRDTRGANMVEYIMLVGLVALACIGIFGYMGGKVTSTAKGQADTIGTAIPTTAGAAN